MKKKYLQGILPILIWLAIGHLTSCSGPEHFVDATQLTILNYDSIPLTILVNGEEATSFETFWGEVHLNSGDYEVVAQSEGKEIDKISISIPVPGDPEWDKHIFSVGGNRSYALCDMRYVYFPGHEIEIEKTFFNESYLHVEANSQHTYYPWRILPLSVYSYDNSTVEAQQLIEIPNDFKEKSEEEIASWCEAHSG